MDVESVYVKYGIDLVRSGSIYKALCPFHSEKTPSFVVYNDGSYYCFGCEAHGTIYTLIEYFGGDKTTIIVKETDQIQEREPVEIKDLEIELHGKLYEKVKNRFYNVKKMAWKQFDTIWVDLKFEEKEFHLLDKLLFIHDRFSEIEEFVENYE